MQNLENEIQQWRERYRVTGQLSEAEIEELESHLRDAVEDLSGRGLSEDEAFLVARRRFGSDESVATEFEKMDPMRVWIQRTKWMLVGTLALQVLLSLRSPISLLFETNTGVVVPGMPVPIMPFLIPLLYTAALIFLFYRCSARIVRILERFSGWCGRRPKTAVLASVLFCCMAPIGFLMVFMSLSEGMQRFFAETPGAVRYDWGNMILNMVWPLAEYGPIGLVILALHRWENRRETISDL